METQVLKNVLQDILEEQKLSNTNMLEIMERMMKTEQIVKSFDFKLMTVRLTVPAIDTSALEGKVHKEMESMDSTLRLFLGIIDKMQKKKRVKEEVIQWVSWIVIVGLCAIIFSIALDIRY